MKFFIKIVVFVAVLGGAFYYGRPELERKVFPLIQDVAYDVRETVTSFLSPKLPCEEPLKYNLARVDTGFNVSEEYVLKAMAEAEAIWEKPFGKDLFVYSPQASRRALQVSFIYDHRQEITDVLEGIDSVLDTKKATYDVMRAKYNFLDASYKNEISSFNQRVLAFNERVRKYEEQVRYWNERGGAPKPEYSQLEKERLAIDQEAKEITIKESYVNNLVEELNSNARELNRLASELNMSVEEYNKVSTNRGEFFQEGLYIENGNDKAIEIYEWSTYEKLVRVLAHELGHALGLEHVEDPEAIMYEKNQGKGFLATQDDLEALNQRCALLN